MANISDVPGTARPLHQACAAQGWTTLADLDGVPRTTVLNLHGVGKAGLSRIEEAMATEGYALRDGHAVLTDTDRDDSKARTGRTDIATGATGADVIEFIENQPSAKRIEQAHELLRIFGDVTGVQPRMWGPSMIGYGEIHYQYATGREGDTMRVGFSPRKSALTLYGLQISGSGDELLERLGKFKLGKGCVYINKLEDIDEEVLRDLIARAWAAEGP